MFNTVFDILKESRREFLKKSSLMALGASTLPIVNMGCGTPDSLSEIGVQLWSIRRLLDQNFEKAIANIAEIGFNYVEAYGLNNEGIFSGLVTANQFERTLANNGMRIASCHTSYFQADETSRRIEIAHRLGVDWVVIAWLSEEQRSGYYEIAENLNAIGEQFKKAGIGFGYHNHDFEFDLTKEGEVPQEILMDNTDPEFVSFQADLYWFKKAGVDPLSYIDRYPGRFCSYHIKDANQNLEQTTIGTGIIDFQKILSKNKLAGIEYVFVEDERIKNSIENLKEGYNFIKKLEYSSY